jgi:chemotaxis protein CheD
MTATPIRARQSLEKNVAVAQWYVLRGAGRLVSHGLGSCVAIILYDSAQRVAGLAHVLLPNETYSRDRSRPAKFAQAAVPHLINEMRRAGATGTLTARLVGGASMFGALLSSSGINMGARNVAAAKEALQRAGVALIAEDVGGEFGRTVWVEAESGVVTVMCTKLGTREL